MIMELAQKVQEYLHQHNMPRFKSFYDEMLSNQKKKEQELAVIEQRKADLMKRKNEIEVIKGYLFPN